MSAAGEALTPDRPRPTDGQGPEDQRWDECRRLGRHIDDDRWPGLCIYCGESMDSNAKAAS